MLASGSSLARWVPATVRTAFKVSVLVSLAIHAGSTPPLGHHLFERHISCLAIPHQGPVSLAREGGIGLMRERFNLSRKTPHVSRPRNLNRASPAVTKNSQPLKNLTPPKFFVETDSSTAATNTSARPIVPSYRMSST